ncbi:hypothetical protein MWS75_002686 [Serratia marcescens]|nr:hypothetical protein [Serratia marcescens]EJA2550653.1 hypothetical protein [Serratia marcescens]EJA2593691.1 hypothetical protein [Serratia marcescens]
MEKYLYLTKPEWADAWVNGGQVPFYKASKYKSEERRGVNTPDENLIDSSTVDIQSLAPNMVFSPGSVLKNCVFVNNTIDGRSYKYMRINRFIEDGLVVCLSNKRSMLIARRLEKKACVKIKDVNELMRIINDQIGVEGVMGPCKYTINHERNHFLKSTKDAWQREYRMFWPEVGDTNILLPPGVAELEFTMP